MILGIQESLYSEGVKVTMSQLCRWFELPRRTVYYKPCKVPPKVQERFEAPTKAMIEQGHRFATALWRDYSTSTRTRCNASSRSGAGRLNKGI